MIEKLEILLIKAYQVISNPVYKTLEKLHINFFKCRYIPTCSEYSIEAIEKYGVRKGTKMALKRVMECNPNYLSGYDPVE